MTDGRSGPPADPFAAAARLLDRRAAGYRNLVLLVVLIGFAAPLAALTLGSLLLLLGWLWVVPASAVFLALDARAVARWRAGVLDGWAAGEVDLDSLRDGLSAIRALPAGTLAGLLDPLPTRSRLDLATTPPAALRAALAATVRAIDGCLVRQTVMAAAGATLAVVSLLFAVAAGEWWPLAAPPVAVVIVGFARRSGSRPPRRWVRDVEMWKPHGLSSAVEFTDLARRLDWRPLPARATEGWLTDAFGTDR